MFNPVFWGKEKPFRPGQIEIYYYDCFDYGTLEQRFSTGVSQPVNCPF